MFREGVQSFLDNKIFINELKKSFTDFECYTLGIIDENGNKIKQIVTEQEAASYSPMIKTIIRIKRFLGSKTDLLEKLDSSETKLLTEEGLAKHQKLLEYKDRIDDVINDLYRTIEEAKQDGFNLEEVKKLIQA